MGKWKKYENKGWYCYNGVGDPYHASSYRRVNSKPSGETGKYICAIYADCGHITPQAPLSSNIQQYIAEAMVSGGSQPPHPRVREKCFVYVRD